MARIFVIDDDEQLLHMVGLMLERGGHSVTLINDPRESIKLLEAEKPDLLVLDVMMPDVSGHDLTRQIRATSGLEELPILILTARSQDVDRDTALRTGADGYLSKPVTSQELIARIDELLSKKPEQPDSKESSIGMTLAFFGLRGGVGKTTLATNVALALRRASHQEVCLVDFSSSGSQAAIHLHLNPSSNWAELPVESLDWPSMKEHLAIHPTGLRLLAAPSTPVSSASLSAETTKSVLSLLRSQMMFTVLDLPPVFNPAFLAALETADIGLHVVTPDVVSVKTAVQVTRALAKSGHEPKQKSYILNQVAERAQLPAAAVERALNGRVPFQISFDPNQIIALTQGVPLVLGSTDSPLPTVTKRMADVVWKRVKTKAGLA